MINNCYNAIIFASTIVPIPDNLPSCCFCPVGLFWLYCCGRTFRWIHASTARERQKLDSWKHGFYFICSRGNFISLINFQFSPILLLLLLILFPVCLSPSLFITLFLLKHQALFTYLNDLTVSYPFALLSFLFCYIIFILCICGRLECQMIETILKRPWLQQASSIRYRAIFMYALYCVHMHWYHYCTNCPNTHQLLMQIYQWKPVRELSRWSLIHCYKINRGCLFAFPKIGILLEVHTLACVISALRSTLSGSPVPVSRSFRYFLLSLYLFCMQTWKTTTAKRTRREWG